MSRDKRLRCNPFMVQNEIAMKSIVKTLSVSLLLTLGLNFSVQAQAFEAQQLLYTLEKYNQNKKMLSQITEGYQIVSSGYDKIKNVASGNFNLHDVFISGLMAVNPEIKKYRRVPDIINYQAAILKEYQSAFSQFKKDGNFTTKEIDYISKVYSNLFDKSIENLDQLLMVTTANKTQMSDGERIAAIDRIYKDIQDKYLFLKSFNGSTKVLSLQRARTKNDLDVTKSIYGIK